MQLNNKINKAMVVYKLWILEIKSKKKKIDVPFPLEFVTSNT